MDFEEIGTVSTFGEAEPGDLMLIAFGDEDVVACKVVIGDQSHILTLEPTRQGYDNVAVFSWRDEHTSLLLLDDYHFRLLMPKDTDIGLTSDKGIGPGQIFKTPDGHYMIADSNDHIVYFNLADGVLGNQPPSPYVTFRNWEIRHKTLNDIELIATFPFPQKGGI